MKIIYPTGLGEEIVGRIVRQSRDGLARLLREQGVPSDSLVMVLIPTDRVTDVTWEFGVNTRRSYDHCFRETHAKLCDAVMLPSDAGMLRVAYGLMRPTGVVTFVVDVERDGLAEKSTGA